MSSADAPSSPHYRFNALTLTTTGSSKSQILNTGFCFCPRKLRPAVFLMWTYIWIVIQKGNRWATICPYGDDYPDKMYEFWYFSILSDVELQDWIIFMRWAPVAQLADCETCLRARRYPTGGFASFCLCSNMCTVSCSHNAQPPAPFLSAAAGSGALKNHYKHCIQYSNWPRRWISYACIRVCQWLHITYGKRAQPDRADFTDY